MHRRGNLVSYDRLNFTENAQIKKKLKHKDSHIGSFSTKYQKCP